MAVALVIGTIELGGLIAQRLGAHGSLWAWLEHININTLGLIIAGTFLATYPGPHTNRRCWLSLHGGDKSSNVRG